MTYPFGAAQGGVHDDTDEEVLAASMRPPDVFGELNAQTYLPLRMDKLHWISQDSGSVQQHDFQFLPPTPANLAKISVTIPPGYRRAPG